MTTGQRPDPALSAVIDAIRAAGAAGEIHVQSVTRVVDAVRAAAVPPLAELVTDEDVQVATAAYYEDRHGSFAEAMRAALEAYGARLLARHGRDVHERGPAALGRCPPGVLLAPGPGNCH